MITRFALALHHLRFGKRVAWALGVLTLGVLLAVLTVPYVDAAEPELSFEADVRPILQKRCVGCHGPERQEARFRLDTLSVDLINDRAAAEHWHEVLNVLHAGEMPPEDEPQLSAAERKALTGWLSKAIQSAIDAQRSTGGRVVIRRLNRLEYRNTMFDLLGIDMDYARDLPPDPRSSDGFRNNGQSLQLSSLQLEQYLSVARRALEKAIVIGPAPQVFHHEFTESNVRGWLRDTEMSNRLGRQQKFLATMPKEYPEEGEFLIRVKLSAELKPDKGYPILTTSVGYRPDTQVLFHEASVVEITSADEQIIEVRGRLENHPLPVRGQGKFPGLVIRLQNTYDDGSPLPKAGKVDKKTVFPEEPDLPTLQIHSVEFTAPAFDQWPPASHRRLLFESELRETDEAAYVREVVRRFARRAFRRPVTDAEVARYTEFFSAITPVFPTFEDAVRETLAMVLISPDFLFMVEPSGDAKREINDWELATRLSYFLWSTMPDERLFELSESGTLHEDNVVSGEVARMLADERARRFVDRFTAEWLQLETIDRVAVNRDVYPDFSEKLKPYLRRESQELFAHLLTNDLSALRLLDADFTMLNESLARHYGMDGVYGREFRPVTLPADSRRGGLLGHAGILLSNSTGSDSHPVRRAVWIRDRLLADPPAPPPPNVPSLDEADPEFLKLSVREQLEIHRNTEACASCHRGIDPWGIALEHFDAVGKWRDEIRRGRGKKAQLSPVVAVDRLPNGRELNGADDLRQYLVEDRAKDFARSLASRMLAYAVGRRLELSDQATVEDITSSFRGNDYNLRHLVHAIVASESFRTK